MHTCELVSSPAVFRELARGTSAHVPARLALILGLPLLVVTPEAIRTAKVYRHLANHNKFNQIRRINTELGLQVPVITSPQHLRGSNEQA